MPFALHPEEGTHNLKCRNAFYLPQNSLYPHELVLIPEEMRSIVRHCPSCFIYEVVQTTFLQSPTLSYMQNMFLYVQNTVVLRAPFVQLSLAAFAILL